MPSPLHPLQALSPLDGRYAEHLAGLRQYASEAGLIGYRVKVEVNWLLALAQSSEITEIPVPNKEASDWLLELSNNLDADAIKQHEAKTNHDVKAVEYWVKQQLAKHQWWKDYIEFVHFGCTSEDINNLAYALMIGDIRNSLLKQIDQISELLREQARAHAKLAMLSLTHGQAASPTTLGKEIINSLARLEKQANGLRNQPILGKLNGAVGNFNAHQIAYTKVNWRTLAEQTVEQLGLVYNPLTTQIEPHDWIAEWCHWLVRINTILVDLSRDIWGYISRGLFVLTIDQNETGSSTMPHKVNPIDFENAEGNLGLANAMLNHMAEKLPISRWQRDLTDSTVLRNIGCAAGYCAVGYNSLERGLNKITPNARQIKAELTNNPEVLAEALQTVMRRYGVKQPYEKLKALSRGREINLAIISEFINKQPLPEEVKTRLKTLTPASYTGLAELLCKDYLEQSSKEEKPD